jgi:hypothetical protein
MTEPDSGSDGAAHLAVGTRALRADWHQTLATNGPVADLALARQRAARDEVAGRHGVLVDRDTPGVSFGPPIEKMGLRTSPMGEIVSEARVPVSARLALRAAACACSSLDGYERLHLRLAPGAMRRLFQPRRAMPDAPPVRPGNRRFAAGRTGWCACTPTSCQLSAAGGHRAPQGRRRPAPMEAAMASS